MTFDPALLAPNEAAPIYIVASAGSGGLITPNGYVNVNYSGNHTFTITPNNGYHVADVTVNGTSVGAVSSYTVENIQGMTTISATFAVDPTPTPSPTASPTSSNTQPSASSSPSPSPTSVIPEFSSILLMTIIVMAVTAITSLHKRMARKV